MTSSDIDFNEEVEKASGDRTLMVAELYPNVVFQGEGPSIGKPCTFLRLGACNLTCGVNGGWQCDSVLQGTLIRMADGSSKAIEYVQAGEEVLGVERQSAKGTLIEVPRYVRAQALFLNEHLDDNCYELIFEDQTKLVCTGNHKILVQREVLVGKDWKTDWSYVETQYLTGKEQFWPVASTAYSLTTFVAKPSVTSKLVSKTKLVGTYRCYDIGSSSQNFFANGILVHNSSNTWDWTGLLGVKYDPKTELKKMAVSAIFEHYKKLNIDRIIITGGEPLLQQKSLPYLMSYFHHQGWYTEIETNGTITPSQLVVDLCNQFNVSPKLSNSGNIRSKRVKLEAMKALVSTDKAYFKFVVSSLSDFDEIQDYVDVCCIPKDRVYVMPEGIYSEDVKRHMQLVAEETVRRRWNLTTRLQVLVYENQRMV